VDQYQSRQKVLAAGGSGSAVWSRAQDDCAGPLAGAASVGMAF